ncbi:UDP-N-acetylenolpyruvoylglucosamine reductase [Methylocaldum marinum]|uniref:UDP-N-acetylenolpyruvoylglucosamine reductase n=1 Tax=Methylocaldum marinum TaxID=1432792 RepID=A0A250KYI2_9GAMM|nr:UDP-N-acetylenolpyruvoylglucosamine reductase [Methylocaldum marinum]
MVLCVDSVKTADPIGLRGEMRYDEPLANYTSWRVGGPADRFYLPADAADMVLFLHSLPPDEPILWLGLGSNLLVRDGGFRGTVICTRNRLKEIRSSEEEGIYAEAGVPSAHVARFCSERNLTGAEFLAGIPGTLGGALAMNAGAFGGETWPLVARVLTVDRSGTLRYRSSGDFLVGYRSVRGPENEWFLACELRLQSGDALASRERIRSLLAKRSASQPINLPNCGSVFRNPEGDYAARLIEACGLKGHSIGGACVSEKHANFIVNTGMARAADIEALMQLVQATVEKTFGLRLIPEVRIVGEESIRRD